MPQPKTLLLLLLTHLTTTTAISPPSLHPRQSPPEKGLHDLFLAAGKSYFGTATETTNLPDPLYQSILSSGEFGQITPENSQKWESLQPTSSTFTFAAADQIVSLATQNNQILRCHTLVWHSQLPSFVKTTAWTPSSLTALLKSHISNVMGHYKGKCTHWDVVNEALNEDGSFRPSIFLEVLGPGYIPLSFQFAAQADPEAKLYYNDFNLEISPPKAAGAVKIVKLVQDAKQKIDGVGFQGHLTVGQLPPLANLTATLRQYTELGVEVAFTELDIAHPTLPSTEQGREQQGVDYVTVTKACLAVEKCVGITVWQFTDRYSWVEGTFPGTGEACLFTRDYERKSAYFALKKFLEGVVGRNGTAGNGTAGKGGSLNLTAAGVVPVRSEGERVGAFGLGSMVLVVFSAFWMVMEAL
ncbi:glycoside hydrolase superfamily [Podospora australis]|uniref:Beta-xylanase n=1 Tax=Podospora australis TaxID=1536484 RepID=A0AAN6X0Y7_9PEZI|nr:glycoside hydrolase superfamily [Podospora australis]